VRVIRRTRPSQVGCGSTTVRRRILHIQPHGAQPRQTPPNEDLSTQATTIGIGFVAVRESPGELHPRAGAELLTGQAAVVLGARARGR
jgi:hypothetical protein